MLGWTSRSRERGIRRGPGVYRNLEVNTTAAKEGRESRNLLGAQVLVRGTYSISPIVAWSVVQHWSEGIRAMPAKPPLLRQRDDARQREADTPGPLGPGMGKDHATQGLVTDLGCLCTSDDDDFNPVTHSLLALALAPRCSSCSPPPRPSTPDGDHASESDHPRRMEAGENVYKMRTSHPSWLSSLDNHSIREQAPFKGSVASWVAVVLFEPSLQPPTSNLQSTHPPPSAPPTRHEGPKQPCLTASTPRT